MAVLDVGPGQRGMEAEVRDIILSLLFLCGWFLTHHVVVAMWGMRAGWLATGLATMVLSMLFLYAGAP